MQNVKKSDVKNIYYLSPMQEGMLFHHIMDGHSSAYFEQLAIHFKGKLYIQKFEDSLNSVISRYDIFRTVFMYEETKRPLQIVLKERKAKLYYENIADSGVQDIPAWIEDFKARDREKGFDLTRDILIRVSVIQSGPEDYEVIWSFHHILMDGWCIGIIIQEFMAIYQGFVEGNTLELGPVQPYGTYINWLENQDKKQAGVFWRTYLEEYDRKIGIPQMKKANRQFYDQKNLSFTVDEDLTKKLEQIAVRNNATLNTVFQSIWGILLHKYNNTDDSVFGSVVSGRPAEIAGVEKIIGLFINTIPVRIKCGQDDLFSDLIRQVQQSALESEKFSYLPLAEIQSASELKQDLIDHIIIFENFPVEKAVAESNSGELELSIENVESFEQTNYDFNIIVAVGNKLLVKFSFNRGVYDEKLVAAIEKHFKQIANSVASRENIRIKDIELLSSDEKKRVISDFNHTIKAYPNERTVYQLFEEQVEKSPDAIALIFDNTEMSYAELNRKANQLAWHLKDKGLKAEDRVALWVERSPEMITGILGILKAGGAYLPIDPDCPEDRLRFMLEDSGARFVLTQKALSKKYPLKQETIELDNAAFNDKQNTNPGLANKPGNLAYIIYTSGSTGTPKGVMVEHRSMSDRLQWRREEYNMGSSDCVLILISYTFDAFVTTLFTPVLSGARIVLVREEEAKNAAALKNIISAKGITHFSCVPALYQAIVENMKPGEASGLKVVTLGGESVGQNTIDLTRRLNPSLEIANEYGPTECTVVSTILRHAESAGRVTIGRPVANTKIYIIDSNEQVLPVGFPGEMCVSGAGLARGYLNREELTEEKFVNNPFEPGTLMYKTGDLAQWLEDGSIEFLGRIDYQVKVRGYRIELGEIENRLREYEGVKDAVVTAPVDGQGIHYLCAYYVSDAEPALDSLRSFLGIRLPEYMIPAYFMRLSSMPLSSSGKVNRKALPEPDGGRLSGSEYTPPDNETEEKLVKIWEEVLELKKVGTTENFFAIGGHSLKATTVASKILKDLSVDVPLRMIFKYPTVRELAGYINGADSGTFTAIVPVVKRDSYPVSSAQNRLYIINKLEGAETSYNTPGAMFIEGALDRDRLEKAFSKLVERHESFRTSFEIVEGEPVQKIHDHVPFQVEYTEANDEETGKLVSGFIRPFELSQAPLLRVKLVRLNDNKYLLLFDMHHIIADGTSMGILVREFIALYEGHDLPGLTIQYKDFAVWQNDLLQSEVMKKEEEYWLSLFSQEVPVLNLPLDFNRPTIQSFEGRRFAFALDADTAKGLNQLALNTGSTLYMVLLALFNVLLSLYSGQDDIIIGSPIAGRNHADLEGVIGMFVNTLALRNNPNGDKSFTRFLTEVKENTLKAYENQNYQFETLVDKLNLQRDLSRNPLFDVMFVMQNAGVSEPSVEGLKFSPYPFENNTSKFDLTLEALSSDQSVLMFFEYCALLFTAETIERMSASFIQLIKGVLADPQAKLSDIELMTPEEKKRVMLDLNDTKSDYPSNNTIHELFEKQVALTPNQTAIVYEGQAISYQDLNSKANRLARVLTEKGVVEDTTVGIMMNRSTEFVVGIMAILKAGGSIVPIDSQYPEKRIANLLQNSHIGLLLTKKDLYAPFTAITAGAAEQKKPFPIDEVLFLDELTEQLAQQSGENLDLRSNPDRVLYVIYTSGSTGEPKGVLLKHRNLINLICFEYEKTDIEFHGKVLEFNSASFDVCYQTIFSTLLRGGELYIVNEAVKNDPVKLLGFIDENELKVVLLPTSYLKFIMNEKEFASYLPKRVKHIVTAGEQLIISETMKAYLKANHITLHNHYGPSETHVVTTLTLKPESDLPSVPTIGKPISNTQIYILNRYQKLQPVGIVGELYIAGDNVGKGYLNRPDLTDEKFVPNPFQAGERMYKTGDLARWLADGTIEFLGRIDFQVKIRGFRIELGEIENRLLKYPDVKEAVVIDRTAGNNDKYLCAYYTASRTLTTAELREFISQELPEYMVPSYLIQVANIALTHNGKIDRKQLPDPEGNTQAGEAYIAPRDETEAKLAELWQNILGTEKVGINDNFFFLGGHSLKATILVSRIYKELNVEVPLREVFRSPTITRLAKYINHEAKQSLYAFIKPADKREYYPVSSAQKRLYIINKFEGIGVSYNMPTILIVEGNLDVKRLENTFKALIKRHDAFRTSFEMVDGELVQRVRDDIDFRIEYQESPQTGVESIIEGFVRPFDLSRSPLLRIGLVKQSENQHILLLDMHHIISDGTSMGILIDECVSVYEGKELAPLRVQYKDFAVWQNELFIQEGIRKQEEYWLEKFNEDLPVLNLPTDYPRPPIQDFSGDTYSFSLNSEQAGRLKQLVLATGTTVNIILLAVYSILLYRYTGQEDVVIGHGIAGRPHPDLENIVGMFINMLLIRNQPVGTKSFIEFLEHVKDIALEAFENQDYQFEVLVEKIELSRDMSRNPLFDVSFVTQNMNIPELKIEGLAFKPYILEHQTSKFDLTLYAVESGDEINFIFEYCTALFSKKTMEIMAGHYLAIIENILNTPEIKLENIGLLTHKEKQMLLTDFIQADSEGSKAALLHQLFEEQADKTPEGIALVFNKQSMTYRELDAKASRLARYLQDNQIRPEMRVGVLLENSFNQIIAILGILKAGGAYIPIDPDLPEDRMRTIINDAELSMVVSGRLHLKILNRLQWECEVFKKFICLDTTAVLTEEESVKNELMNEKLWNYVASTATDAVSGGGWVNSFTGENMSQQEMDEYGQNVILKLKPFLNKNTRVLEIGCASGITMYSVAPSVSFYYGTDLSEEMIRKNQARIDKDGIANIKLETMAASDIDRICSTGFDLIIINSVIQCFNEHNYLRNVIRKALNHLNEKGVLFIGDVMDHDLKYNLLGDLADFKNKDTENRYKTKTDLSAELFVSRAFFDDLKIDFTEIKDIQYSQKIATIENELTRYRYDAVFYVDKSKKDPVKARRNKHQDGLTELAAYSEARCQSDAKPDNLAYVIYTSGTTGKPKGVMIEHRSIVNTINWRRSEYGLNEKDHVLQLFNVAFDGFLTSVFTPLLSGGKLILMNKEEARSPVSIKNRIASEKISHFICVPTLFHAILDCVTTEELKTLRVVTLAGEAVSQDIVLKAKELNPALEIANEYGPTENSVATSIKRDLDGVSKITIGKPIAGSRVYILDKLHNLAPICITGELCVSGKGLARGYLQNKELTVAKFVDNPFEPGARMYKTGDLTRWMPNGEIEFLGRVDHQVKIRGFRIELGDIESRLMKHGSVREVLVIASEDEGGGKFIAAYFTATQRLSSTELRQHLSQELPDYMIPSYFIQLENIPLNASGKVNRKALPKPGENIQTGVEYAAPGNETERKLTVIWEDVLGVSRVGIYDNFFILGGHSLKATILASRIFKEFSVEVPLRDIFQTPTVHSLARFIQNAESNVYSAIMPVPEREYYPVSPAQKRLYIIDKLEGSGTTYNMPGILVIEGNLDRKQFELVFQELINRHEAFRTSFVLIDGEPVQKIADRVDFKVNFQWASEDEVDAIVDSFIQPFDLTKSPLLRVGLIKVSDEKHIFMYDMHHIISDGTSMGILNSEFIALYYGKPLPELRIQYKDFSAWQNAFYQTGQIRKMEEYWLDAMKGEIPALNMPVDYKRPPVQSFEGENFIVQLPAELTAGLNKLVLETGTTLFMVFLAVYNILLSRYSGQEDIIVGSPIAGRSHADLEKIIGIFLNTLVFRNYPNGQKTFLEFLGEVKEGSLKAYENQAYQFEDLVEKLNLQRDLSRNPLFDVMFIMQNMDMGQTDTGELRLSPYRFENKVSKFDMTLQAMENPADRSITLIMEYCTRLYRPESIKRFMDHFVVLTERVVQNPSANIADFDIVTGDEREKLVRTFNNTELSYPKEKLVHQLFEERAASMPDAPALVFAGMTLTYKQLNEEANRLAGTLRKNGVQTGGVVGIMVERSCEMIVAIIGVLKAGGAYLPVDPQYPALRKKYLLENSHAAVLLTQKRLTERPDFNGKVIYVDSPEHKHESTENKAVQQPSDSLAYLIYTSGSTGQPKGVMIPHQAVVNFIYGMADRIDFSQNKTILCLTSMSFDIFVLETLLPLAMGLKIVIADENQQQDARSLHELMSAESVQMLQTTPSRLQLFLAQGLNLADYPVLSEVLVGGEAFPEDLLSKLSEFSRLKIYNMYGPTETTVWSTMFQIEEKGTLHIGKPIANTQVYIVDSRFRLVPTGVAGELCIAGDGLAKGYYEKPELTAEKFVDNPIVPGEKMYRTGDLARWLSDGNIEFLGRMDHQVKIRGYRIELGEIENLLLRHEDIESCAVLAKKDKDGSSYLCAYFVGGRELSVAELRSFLLEELPDYMVPSLFIKIESMPLTPNAKIDRKALPEPTGSVLSGTEYVAPRNDFEEKLVAICQEILGIQKMGVYDNFFDMGGHSLKVITLMIRIFEEFGVEYPLKELFSSPTVANMGEYISDYSIRANSDQLQESMMLMNSPQEKGLFAFPGIGAYVLVYKVLAQYVKNRAFYAFNFMEQETRFNDYADLIQGAQKEGPYVLMGYSAGGNLAFEVAKELNRKGRVVSDLILIDSTREKAEPSTAENGEKKEFDLDKPTGNKLVDQINQKIKKYIEFLDKVDNSGKIDANIHLIQSEDLPGTEFYLKGKEKWAEATEKKFTVYQGKGSHNDMLEGQNLKSNIMIIRQIIGDENTSEPAGGGY